jgi:hypothetical protein
MNPKKNSMDGMIKYGLIQNLLFQFYPYLMNQKYPLIMIKANRY